MTVPLLDTNVPLRHLVGDGGDQAGRSTDFMKSLADGETRAEILPPVVFELAFTLRRSYRLSRDEVSQSITETLLLEGAIVPERKRLLDALALHARYNISVVDAYIATEATARKAPVISFDRGFDRIPGLTRTEP